MTFLKAIFGILLAAVFMISYLGLSSDYESAMRASPDEARVIDVRGTVVRYELHKPGSPWDKDGDGWIGPYVDNDVPESKAAGLSPGAPLVVRQGRLEISLAPPTKLLLLGIVAGLVFTVWAFVGPMLEARALKRAMSNPQMLFELMVRKTRATKLIAGLLLVAIGGGIAVLGAIIEAKTWERVFILGLGCSGLALGAGFLSGAWKLRDITKAPILQLLRHERDRIVWVYEERVEVNNLDSYNIHICCKDGARFEFNIGQWDPTPLLHVLGTQVPDAVFGYSAKRLELYRASPQSFLEKTLDAA